ncbi:MAG: amino acid ABC transporter ATP-binding protein [Rhodobacter sp.]|nr:amino acid ABC transporter ATP-binding protein [Rhodobacter sp.]MCA3514088.1 amino acid ABC transporter ATP-binding protein [Rhodobacter sp.]MCA3520171.1 amino acid ABC transporter ATP-binding protein [Rhodobacter sp.]MCA3522102.1 amino acid ABC transporter ATP-binding protein [Rhodobacter sp.]MCA3524677.1 amino acid ABC transporter ATP-binding protein [Rhodobacter sp.]
MADAFLTITALEKSYGAHKVLKGIDLSVNRHEVVCLIGASGSGKSTLLRCVNALERIDSGVIALDGDPVSGIGVDVNRLRRKVGMVFQSFNLFPHLSVIENVMLAPVKVNGLSRDEARERALKLLDRIGLSERAGYMPDQLSGGQQQRVAIIRCMAMDPQVLLLDEVTSALDPELVGEVLDILKDLAKSGMTMLLATHEMRFARDVATTVAFLHEGQLIEKGPPGQIFDSPQMEETQKFLRRALFVPG